MKVFVIIAVEFIRLLGEEDRVDEKVCHGNILKKFLCIDEIIIMKAKAIEARDVCLFYQCILVVHT